MEYRYYPVSPDAITARDLREVLATLGTDPAVCAHVELAGDFDDPATHPAERISDDHNR